MKIQLAKPYKIDYTVGEYSNYIHNIQHRS